ncbi:hypothetical protein STEG23_016661 [Scotinomys teguina]
MGRMGCYGNIDNRHQRRTQLHQDHRPKHGHQHILDPVVTVALGGSTDLSDQSGPSNNVVPELQHGPWWLPRPMEAEQPLVIKGAVGFNTDAGCGGTRDPGIVPGISPGLDITSDMTFGSS